MYRDSASGGSAIVVTSSFLMTQYALQAHNAGHFDIALLYKGEKNCEVTALPTTSSSNFVTE
jgi:hypothetical protein